MIVDDDPSILTTYGALLSREGHRISTRDRAYGTAPAIISARPDVVLLDVNMPGLYGPEIVRVFHGRPRETKPVFILFGGADTEALQLMAHDCGADAGISKTEQPRMFLIAFRTVLVGCRRQAVGT